MHHVAEEDRAVAACKRVGVREVLLELAVRVLVVVRVVPPAELVHVVRHAAEKAVVAREPAQVVAGLFEVVERIGDAEGAVLVLADEEVLELEAHHEVVARRLRLLELVAQDRPWVVGPLLALDIDVAGEAAERRLPGDRCEAAEVRDGGDVRVAGELADLAGGEPREAGAVLDELVEVRGRDELRARPRVHVDELREVELDAPLFGDAADLVDAGRGDRRHLRPPFVGPGEDNARPARCRWRFPTARRTRMCRVRPSRRRAGAGRA